MFPFRSQYYISKVETPTQLSVGLMLLSHFWQFLSGRLGILENSTYSSCSRPHIVLSFLYTKPKVFSNSVFLCSLSNFSFALSFACLFCHRCLRGRWLPFVALFNKSLLSKGIVLLSSKQSASVPGHISLRQTCTALHLTHLIHPLLPPSTQKYLRQSVFMFSVNRI